MCVQSPCLLTFLAPWTQYRHIFTFVIFHKIYDKIYLDRLTQVVLVAKTEEREPRLHR